MACISDLDSDTVAESAAMQATWQTRRTGFQPGFQRRIIADDSADHDCRATCRLKVLLSRWFGMRHGWYSTNAIRPASHNLAFERRVLDARIRLGLSGKQLNKCRTVATVRSDDINELFSLRHHVRRIKECVVSIRSRLLPILLAVALGAGILWDSFPLNDASERLENLTNQGPGFRFSDVSLTVKEASWYSSVHARKRLLRTRSDAAIMMMIDGAADRHCIHDPTYCLRGDGWTVESHSTIELSGGQRVSHLRVSRGTVTREAVYWFSDGRRVFRSISDYWWWCSLRRMTFGASGEEPVFVMLQPACEKAVHWRRLFESVPALFE